MHGKNLFGGSFYYANYSNDVLKIDESSIQSEEYIYAYRLNGAMTQKQLKNKLKKITFNQDDVDDPYFKDYWEETAGKKDDIKDGIKKLTDASTQM